jgi:hypothetical protein
MNMNKTKSLQFIALTALLAINAGLPLQANDSLPQQIIGGLFKPVAREVLESGKIFGGAVGAAVAYGIINDQVTVRVCPEYFTQGFHRSNVRGMGLSKERQNMLLDKNNPTKIGLWWGVNATWWFGALLGVPTIAAARVGSWPKLQMEDLVKPVGVGVAGLLGTGLVAGIIGYNTVKNKQTLKEKKNMAFSQGASFDAFDFNEKVCHGYVIDAYAHKAAYAGGAAVTLGLVGYTLYERYNRS